MIGTLFGLDQVCSFRKPISDVRLFVPIVEAACLEVLLQVGQATPFANIGLASFDSFPGSLCTLVSRSACFETVTSGRHLVAERRKRGCRSAGAIAPHY